VRSQQPGKFANELFVGMLTTVLCSDAFNANLLGARVCGLRVRRVLGCRC
jgi:hypothetical protein